MVDLNGSLSGFGGYRFNVFETINMKKSLGVRLIVLEIIVKLRGLSVGFGQFRRAVVYIHSGKIVTLSGSGHHEFHGFGFEVIDDFFL